MSGMDAQSAALVQNAAGEQRSCLRIENGFLAGRPSIYTTLRNDTGIPGLLLASLLLGIRLSRDTLELHTNSAHLPYVYAAITHEQTNDNDCCGITGHTPSVPSGLLGRYPPKSRTWKPSSETENAVSLR